MNAYHKHHQNLATMTPRLGRAALRALVSATLFPFVASCGATEPATPGRNVGPNAEELGATPGDDSRHGDIQVDYDLAPGVTSISPEQLEQAKRETERMVQIMRDTKPGGCDPPPLLPSGACEDLVTCDSFPFLAYSTSMEVNLFIIPLGEEVPPGAQLGVEVIKCGATPATVMTRSERVPENILEADRRFSVPTEPEGKYLLRLSNKVPGLRVMASYQVDPGGY